MLSADGPYISSKGGGVALGSACEIWHMEAGEDFGRAKPGGWWITKYGNERRIHLTGFTPAEVNALSEEFGIPVRYASRIPVEAEYRRFPDSPAFEGLRAYVRSHPRIAEAHSPCQSYVPGWHRHALEEVEPAPVR